MLTPTGGVGSGCGPDDQVIEVESTGWVEAVADSLAEGYTFLDSLIGVDEILRPRQGSEVLRVVLRLLALAPGQAPRGRRLQTWLPRQQPTIASVADLIPGASWYQREVHDFFGVEFIGGDLRPLLWHHQQAVASATARGDQPPAAHPLLKDALLQRRIDTLWPGAKDPAEDASPQASRRRTLPPGVPDPEVLADPTATEVEVVASLAGGRMRRRK